MRFGREFTCGVAQDVVLFLGGAMLLRHFDCLDDMELGQLSRIFGLVHKSQQVVEAAKAFF